MPYIDVSYTNVAAFDPSQDLKKLKLTFVDDFDKLELQENGGPWRQSFYADGTLRSLKANGEKQIYMDPAYKGLGVQPLSTAEGVLNIHAARASNEVKKATGYDYTSGMISSKSAFNQTYGYFEIRCQLPNEKGTWPAFWLLPQDGSWPPELDVFEVLGKDPSKVHTSAHSKAEGKHTADTQGTKVGDLSSGMHTFGVLWTKSQLAWFVDGKKIFQAPTPADMNKPMFIIANLAIGGEWPGDPDPNFKSADMKVDYIKVYSFK